MPRYVAFLRGVSPMNAKMAELRRSLESVGFTNVKTVLSSGNVAFSTGARSEATLARQAEATLAEHLGRTFYTVVRPQSVLRELIESDPYAAFHLPADAKRVVTFLGEPHKARLPLPLETDGVRILAIRGRQVIIAYVPHPRGPVFMAQIERYFGTNVTTRTWETVKKCAIA